MKNLLPGFESFPDQPPSARGVFYQAFDAIKSVFFASHLLVHASFTLEIMNVSAGWQRWVEQSGKYFKMALFASKTVVSLEVML